MSTGVLNLDLGLALGKHDMKYTIEHTGKGYVSFLANMPFIAKIKKGESTFEEVKIAPSKLAVKRLNNIRECFGCYSKVLALRQELPLVITEKPTFDLNKLREIRDDLKLSIFSKFFSARASIDISEALILLNELEVAMDVERVRSGILL